MVEKDVVKVEQLLSGKLFQPYAVVKYLHFGNTFLDAMYNQIYFVNFVLHKWHSMGVFSDNCENNW